MGNINSTMKDASFIKNKIENNSIEGCSNLTYVLRNLCDFAIASTYIFGGLFFGISGINKICKYFKK